MQQLSSQVLQNLDQWDGQQIVNRNIQTYPEKILVFGTGNFLRGFIGYFIDQANKNGNYKGRAVMVQSTGTETAQLLNQQDGLYSHSIKGIKDGEPYTDFIINAAVSRALTAKHDWQEIIKLAESPEIDYIFSNSTEVGLQYVEEPISQTEAPESYPAKLLTFLYHRYTTQGESNAPGVCVLPLELIIDNGEELLQILMRLADYNDLEDHFKRWMQSQCSFCNTLVDRIVPGKPDAIVLEEFEQKAGYRDDLMLVSEPYYFFAVETPKDKHIEFPWAKGLDCIIVDDDITLYRERKLRLLNGLHSIFVGLAHLVGLKSVQEAMEDEDLGPCIHRALFEEIVPAMPYEQEMLKSFAQEVEYRLRNPYIHHRILSITLQYTNKMRARNADTFVRYFRKFKKVPQAMTLGFAGFLYFIKPHKHEDGKYLGSYNGNNYPLNDNASDYWNKQWPKVDLSNYEDTVKWVNQILKNKDYWPSQLASITGLASAIARYLVDFHQYGVRETLKKINAEFV